MNSCHVCAAPLVGRHPRAKFCTPKCARAGQGPCSVEGCAKPRRAKGVCSTHYNARIAPDVRYKKAPAKCSQCGESYVARDYRHSQRYATNFCSFTCRSRYRWEHGDWERTPTRCNLPPDHPVAVFVAADRQAEQARAEARRVWPSCRVFVKDCTICSSCFTSPSTHVTTCSAECAERKRRADKAEHNHRRRARERDAFIAPVSRFRTFDRDGWRCHLCGKATSRNEQVPHPLAPTLDHVIPLAAGGTHEPSNVKTAHFLCNARKGARGGGEQLMLIG